MPGGSEQHRLEFSSSDRCHVFVRLLPQARQALLQACSSRQQCSLQYSGDGGPHVMPPASHKALHNFAQAGARGSDHLL